MAKLTPEQRKMMARQLTSSPDKPVPKSKINVTTGAAAAAEMKSIEKDAKGKRDQD